MSHVLQRLYHIGKPLSAQLLEFANGSIIEGIDSEYKFGYNPEVTTVEYPVWSEQAKYVFLDSPTQINVSSNAITDNAASSGAGAWTVEVIGLNADRDIIAETITLDGNTAVLTSNIFFRVNRMIVKTAGSNEQNEGNIYAGIGGVTDGVPVDVIGKIDVGENQTLQAVYSVPRNNTIFITSLHIGMGKVGQAATVRLKVRPENGVFQTMEKMSVLSGAQNFIHSPPRTIEANSDIQVTAQTSAGDADMHASFSMILIEN